MLILDRVSRSYGPIKALDGVSCEIRPHRIAALLGPNGAGKTTLMRIAAGLMNADSGTVSADAPVYFGGSESLPGAAPVNALRRALGLQPVDTFGTRQVGRLSRGQQQIVGLDATFDLDRQTILLDEPWTSLDPEARETFNQRLAAEAEKGKVIVCSSHELDEVSRVADDILFLRDGRAIWKTREELAGFDRDTLLAFFKRDAQ